MRSLALHHMSAMDASPFELVTLAARNNLQGVVPFLYVMPHPKFTAPTLDAGQRAEFLAHLRDNNIAMGAMETLNVVENMRDEMERFEPALETAAFLGVKRAVVHIRDPDFCRSVDNFARLCDLAESYGLSCVIEFAKIDSGCTRNLPDTMKLLRACGKSNCGFAFDFLHVMRTGALDYVATIDARWFGYGQLNDGPLAPPSDEFDEAVNNRGVPGEGDFPLVDLVRLAPKDLPFDIEVPQHTLRAQGVPVDDRVASIVRASRRILEQAGSDYNK